MKIIIIKVLLAMLIITSCQEQDYCDIIPELYGYEIKDFNNNYRLYYIGGEGVYNVINQPIINSDICYIKKLIIENSYDKNLPFQYIVPDCNHKSDNWIPYQIGKTWVAINPKTKKLMDFEDNYLWSEDNLRYATRVKDSCQALGMIKRFYERKKEIEYNSIFNNLNE